MKLRSSLAVVCTAVLAGVGAGAAGAATGPTLFQKRAEEQIRLLFAQLRGPQVASPATCNAGQWPWGTAGVFILPTLSFSSGDDTFTCHIAVRRVLLDLGGAIATEDARGPAVTRTPLPMARSFCSPAATWRRSATTGSGSSRRPRRPPWIRWPSAGRR